MVIFDILRIIAALMVFVIHLFIFVPGFPRPVYDVLSNGGYGVSIFFVISGFLIMESLEHSKSIKEFYCKRISKLIPAYYAILIVGVVVWDKWLMQMPKDGFVLGWLRYFLCLNTWVPSSDYYHWNDLWGLWTIGCFVFFYLIAPVLKTYLGNFKRAAVFMVIMLPVTFVLSKLGASFYGSLGASLPDMMASDNPIYSLNTFAMGICGWYAVREHKEKTYIQIVAILLAGLIGLNMYNRMLWGLLCALIMIAFIDMKLKSNKIGNILKVLGKYSFSLYLVHLPVIEIINYCGISGITYVVLAVAVSVVAAVLLYHVVEKPCGALIKKLMA